MSANVWLLLFFYVPCLASNSISILSLLVTTCACASCMKDNGGAGNTNRQTEKMGRRGRETGVCA